MATRKLIKTFLLTLIACLGSFHFTGSATAQLANDPIEETFTSVLGTESDIMWDAFPAESHSFAGDFASPDCCPETLEPALAKEGRSLCTIKSVLGCTETIEIRPEDEIWIVSARNYDGCRDNREAIEVERLAYKLTAMRQTMILAFPEESSSIGTSPHALRLKARFEWCFFCGRAKRKRHASTAIFASNQSVQFRWARPTEPPSSDLATLEWHW